MLTRVDVDDLQGHTLSLPLRTVTPGYTIKDIEGLDPVKATIVSTGFAQLDGSQFQSAKRENRNLILKIGIEPYFGVSTVQALRAALYTYFSPKSWVKLKFFIDDVETYNIRGVVESFETLLFSKDPEVSVSVICFDPNFLATSPVTVNGNAAYNGAEQTINNPGTVEAGYLLTLSVNRSIGSFSIINRRPDNSVAQLDYVGSLVNPNVVKISTEPANKYSVLNSGGSDVSVLYNVSTVSKWGPLWPGDNYFRVQIPSGATIPFTVVYTPKYGGL